MLKKLFYRDHAEMTFIDKVDVGANYTSSMNRMDLDQLLLEPIQTNPLPKNQQDGYDSACFELFISHSRFPRLLFEWFKRRKFKHRFVFNSVDDNVEMFLPNGRNVIRKNKTATTKDMSVILEKCRGFGNLSKEEFLQVLQTLPESVFVNEDDVGKYILDSSSSSVIIRLVKIDCGKNQESGCLAILVVDFFDSSDASVFKLRFHTDKMVSING